MDTRLPLRRLAVPLAALLLSGCAYDGVSGQAPVYSPGADYVYGPEAQQGPDGWDGQWNPAWDGVEQPGDLFGGQDVASIDVFREPLAPYGRWINTRWGIAFAPDVGPDWRPYVNGRWTEYRLWISDDPWGWATDHYGRWSFENQIGWVWVPDTQWGPHWVAFRQNEQYAGWAPVPPGVQYNIGVGFGSGWGFNNWNSWYGPSWVWAPANVIYLPGLRRNVLPWNQGFNYWQRTRWQNWTPWDRNRGWAGAPGRNYWQGRGIRNPSPISNRVAAGIARGRPEIVRPVPGRRPAYEPGYGRDNRANTRDFDRTGNPRFVNRGQRPGNVNGNGVGNGVGNGNGNAWQNRQPRQAEATPGRWAGRAEANQRQPDPNARRGQRFGGNGRQQANAGIPATNQANMARGNMVRGNMAGGNMARNNATPPVASPPPSGQRGGQGSARSTASPPPQAVARAPQAQPQAVRSRPNYGSVGRARDFSRNEN